MFIECNKNYTGKLGKPSLLDSQRARALFSENSKRKIQVNHRRIHKTAEVDALSGKILSCHTQLQSEKEKYRDK